MNAKELRAAAEVAVMQWDNHDRHRLVAGDDVLLNSHGEPNEVTFARHILANVREDDNDPVTPERLVELGGTRVRDWEVFFPGSFPGIGLRVIQRPSGTWKVLAGEYVVIDEPASLRNMKEARKLLVRCGAIEEEM